jgi:hypothetical protein
LNGSRQWVSIRGKDVNKPVLLFLAGGPGGSQLVTERRVLAGLEDHFVVVNWEQPGAGKSFDAVDRATLTPERYISDGLALVSYLRERFDEKTCWESWAALVLDGTATASFPCVYWHRADGGIPGNRSDVLRLRTEVGQERGDIKKVEQLKAGRRPTMAKVWH